MWITSATLPILVAVVAQLALGVIVLYANARRKANQCFFLLSIVALVWLAALYVSLGTSDRSLATIAIRESYTAGAAVLAMLNFLRLSVKYGTASWGEIARRGRWWIAGTGVVVALCHTPFFIIGVSMRATVFNGGIGPVPHYGGGIYLFALYFAAATIALVVSSSRDLRNTSGRDQAELAFILVGAVGILALTLLLYQVLRFFVEPSKLLWFAPFRVVLFSVLVAYGIATRKILEIGSFLRRAISYLILGLYLIALYLGVWWLASAALRPMIHEARSIAHLIAALTVAFAMAPARGISQALANRLFVGTRGLDFRETMNRATAILRSVATVDELLARFASTIAEAVGTDAVAIFVGAKDGFACRYANVRSDDRFTRLVLRRDGPLIKQLQARPEPVVLDELHRIRRTPDIDEVVAFMESLHIAAALGIFSREQLAGVMLLGPRVSGRIYGSVEQNALQVLCGQLAVALENAVLFTAVQNARIYNETLLANLTTGVIAADADEHITVFNNEAGQITGFDPAEMIDQPLARLPTAIRDMLRETLRSGERQENSEVVIRSGGRNVIVRASSSIFRGEHEQMLGALIVLTDVTALRRLEMQIRRSDRLASLGTLSAGMAHEIKNPLVSIKTFAQLLPERYQDSDFRETFSSLIGHEIDRIDSLVNQLLRFARPAKPLLKPMHVHEVLEKSLQLVGHRLYQKEIKLARFWRADVDTIRADADQLEQVFLNFFLNAMDAMQRGGELTVTTEIQRGHDWIAAMASSNGNGDVHEVLRITIRDNGEGIRSEDIPHVFDPFFTTKDYGTGLGLSVVHGIIEEHGGQIEVESELAKGTAFHILLPLVRFKEEVAA